MDKIKDAKKAEKLHFSQRLRAIRLLSGYSMEALCDEGGIALGTYIGWESTGRTPRVDPTTSDVFKALGVSVEFLQSTECLSGNRFFYIYDGGIIGDHKKNEDALKAKLPQLVPPNAHKKTYELVDGAIFVLNTDGPGTRQSVCIVVPNNYLPVFNDLLQTTDSDKSSFVGKSVADFNSHDLFSLPIPNEAKQDGMMTLAKIRFNQYRTIHGLWYLGEAMTAAQISPEAARKLVHEVVMRVFRYNAVPPDNDLINDLQHAIMSTYQPPPPTS